MNASLTTPRSVPWQAHRPDPDPFAILALPTARVASMYHVVSNLQGVEMVSLASVRDRGDGKVRGLLAPHTKEELVALLHADGAELLAVHEQKTWGLTGFLLYFVGSLPGELDHLREAIGRDSYCVPDARLGIVDVCCIQSGPWSGTYPDLHARMVLKMRDQGVPYVYAMCHVDNPALVKHRRLGYEIVMGKEGEAVEILREIAGPDHVETARYYLLRLDVFSGKQDQLCEAMRAKNIRFVMMDVDLNSPRIWTVPASVFRPHGASAPVVVGRDAVMWGYAPYAIPSEPPCPCVGQSNLFTPPWPVPVYGMHPEALARLLIPSDSPPITEHSVFRQALVRTSGR